MRSRRRGLLALPLILALSGCQEQPVPTERSLLDGRHEPDVLTEATSLVLPPAFSGNRLVSGWLPFASKRGLKGVVPVADGARVEIVNLRRRPRALILRFAIDQPEVSEVVLRHRDREIARQPLSERVRFGLPAKLPLGRVSLDASFSNAEGVMLKEARLHPALAAGEVSFRDGSLVQAPWSAVDFVQVFPAGSVLLGGFQPPRSPSPRQTFEITLEALEGEWQRVFEWTGGGPREIRIDLPNNDTPVRVRLRATGEGGAGRWDGLRVASEARPARRAAVPRAPRVVILYVFDALRADYVGHLGGPAGISPTLDRLAAEGASFTDHLSNAPNTKPSIKSLFIGRPFLARGHESLPATGPPTLAEAFAEAGYRTFALSGSPWVSESFGTDRGFGVRSARAEYRSANRSGVDYNDSAERVHRTALEALDALGSEDRGFLYLHTMHPHNPYLPPEPFLSRFASGIDSTIDGRTPTLMSIRAGTTSTTEADRERLRALYAAGLAYNDAELAVLIDELERRYSPGEALLVLTSDHGEELFDHDGVLHGYTLYDDQLHIPLVFWWPEVIEPRTIEVGTDHLDLSATLRSLVTDDVETTHGEPLWGLIEEPSRGWPKRVRFAAASSVAGGIFMAQSADLKLIWAPRSGHGWGMGRGAGRTNDAEYLFDRRSDPEERQNRAGLDGLEYAWLRARLAAWVERGKLEEIGGEGAEQVDEQTLERLRALGYVD